MVQTLKRAVQPGGRLNHAYLLHGTAGTGKKTLARIFAAGLLCTAEMDRPCGECTACRKVEKDIHPDLIVVRPPEGKSMITVDQVRALREEVHLRPNEGRYRVVLIEGAEKMNISASNALLKVLEEPPPYLVFVLTADNRTLLPETIASRCICLELCDVSPLQAEKWLVRQFPDEDPSVIDEALFCGGGNLGRCAGYLKKDGAAAGFQMAVKLLQSLATGREYDVLEALSPLDGDRDAFIRLLTDVDRLAAESAKAAFLPQSRVLSLVPRFSPTRAIQVRELGDDLRSRLTLNGNLSLLLGYYCAELRNIMERTV
ncbi:MAG: DNA polymerase III subunit delta' [Oscillospiraceae bacterium]|nr:DNA polymerase III subunit delta' [Oscillospiraceae bacterium]